MRYIFNFTIVFLIFSYPSIYAQNSLLADGQIFKLEIQESGIHKIDAEFLRQLGLSPSSINPQHISILGNEGGMLPQPNFIERADGLQENAIYVSGEDDGVFNDSDYVLFYADNADKVYYNESKDFVENELNLYAHSNYYFLKIGTTQGKRISEVEESGNGETLINSFIEVIHHELEETTLLTSPSGRFWYGENFNNTTTYSFDYTVSGLSTTQPIKGAFSLASKSRSQASFDIKLNGQSWSNISIKNAPNFNIKKYETQGHISKSYIEKISSSSNLSISLTYDKPDSDSKGYLDYFTLNIHKALRLYGNQTLIIAPEAIAKNVTYRVANTPSNLKIWDISDINNIKQQAYQKESSDAVFKVYKEVFSPYVIFSGNDFPTPINHGKISNQDLLALSVPDMVIVTYGDFLPEAKRLANFRSNHDNMDIHVVTVNQVYNEFSSGRQDITAIRDFLKRLYDQSDKLKYLLLFGDASYDYKGNASTNSSLVPLYESKEGLHPVLTYSSDDYFGFMDNHEGEWKERLEVENNSQIDEYDLEIGIGRIPAKTLDEARTVVDKIIRYQTAPETLGNWKQKVVFLADDGDGVIHQEHANQLASYVDENYTNFNTQRLFIDDFYKESTPNTPNGSLSPECTDLLNRLVEQGILILNFTGHGSVSGWTSEKVLQAGQLEEWTNYHLMPLMVTATCDFGKYDNPVIVSGAERAILSPKGGAIALLTTTRPVLASKNFKLNKAFYEIVFKADENGYLPRLGDVIKYTKNESVSGVYNRNFTLLGDPSMRLNFPNKQITLTELNGEPIPDKITFKALEKIHLKGEIRENNQIVEDFNGELYTTLFDQMTPKQTLGNGNNPIYNYNSRTNTLFRGLSSITDGIFEVEFIVPKNMTYTVGERKFSLYALSSSDKYDDAIGSTTNVDIAEQNDTPTDTDFEAPSISLFLDNRDFKDGDIVGASSILLADFEDDSGINISEIGVDNNIILTLDNETTWSLNEYYLTAKDDFTKGSLAFPLSSLEDGLHTLTVEAWDTHNNHRESTLSFYVTSGLEIPIHKFSVFPNPATGDDISFSFEHESIGENLSVQLDIISMTGQKISSLNSEVFNASSTVNIKWDRQLASAGRAVGGLYLCRLTVIEESSKKVGQYLTKFILLN